MNKELLEKLRDPRRTDRWQLTNKAANYIESLQWEWEQISARHNMLLDETSKARERIEALKRERSKLNAFIAEQSSRIEYLEESLKDIATGLVMDLSKFIADVLEGNNVSKEEAA